MIQVQPTVFSTTRLEVRLLKPTDFGDLYAMQCDKDVMRYCSKPLSKQETQQQLDEILTSYQAWSRGSGTWGIQRIEDQAFVGTCAIIQRSETEDEIGYRLARRFWGQGFGSELVSQLVRHWNIHGLSEELFALVYTANIASWRILERIGFKLTKEYLTEDGRLDRRYDLRRTCQSQNGNGS